MVDEGNRWAVWVTVGLLVLVLVGLLGFFGLMAYTRRENEQRAAMRAKIAEERAAVLRARAQRGDWSALEELLPTADVPFLLAVVGAGYESGRRYAPEHLARLVEKLPQEAPRIVLQQLRDELPAQLNSGFPSAAITLYRELDKPAELLALLSSREDPALYRSFILQEARALATADRHAALELVAPLLVRSDSTSSGFTRERPDGTEQTYVQRVGDRALEALSGLLLETPWQLPEGDAFYDPQAWRAVRDQAARWWEEQGRHTALPPAGLVDLRVRGMPRDAEGRGDVAVRVEGTDEWRGASVPADSPEARLVLGPFPAGSYAVEVGEWKDGRLVDGQLFEVTLEGEGCQRLEVDLGG